MAREQGARARHLARELLVKALYQWQLAGHSVAVPTWHYGHEPSTPLATHVAKYFQNSIREDGLLAVATSGVVYAAGSAGTTQEIFQDAAQNYYETFGPPSPMVFLDAAHWSERLPALPLLRALLGEERYAAIVRVESDRDAIVDFLDRFPRPEPPSARLEKWGQPNPDTKR